MGEQDEPSDMDRKRQVDRDILAERRARRLEPGDAGLLQRAEMAEATVRTLETHITELQRRVRDTAEERQRTLEQLAEREQDVRRVKQREYAEQQLRVEAEDRREQLQREKRAEIDRLQHRVNASERHVRELTDELERVRRELAEAEQAAAAERVALTRSERELLEREAELNLRELEFERSKADVEQRVSSAQASERQATALRERAEHHSGTLAARLQTLELHADQARREADTERSARKRAELQLGRAREGYLRMGLIVRELMRVASELRAALQRERSAPREQQPATQPVYAPPPPATQISAAPAQPQTPDDGEMAQALAAAVERLRARVAAVGELQSEQARAEPVAELKEAVAGRAEPDADAEMSPTFAPARHAETSFHPRLLAASSNHAPWLAPAIRAVAEGRDAKLAAELILELLPAQRLVMDRPTRYGAKLTELGSFIVELEGEQTRVRRVPTLARDEQLDFILEGPAAAFSELAGGGARRRQPGLRVRAGKRRARRLRAARSAPVALAELAGAGIRVWPGLLLLALAEAIDPAWTAGHRFVVAFRVDDEPGAVLQVRVRDGEPLVVTRVRDEQPLATVRLSELAFVSMLAGVSLPAGEQVLVDGSAAALQLLLGWTDRAQGLGAGG
ncbi:MAG TPA: hypothetical protein VLJ42_05465 [Solirubrobacteraceae bacterium]|nr:hypothetical protein [Solirubrobacteraceae bacterium]